MEIPEKYTRKYMGGLEWKIYHGLTYKEYGLAKVAESDLGTWYLKAFRVGGVLTLEFVPNEEDIDEDTQMA